MELTTLTRSNLLLLLDDVAEVRELVADVMSDLQDMGLLAFVVDGPDGQIVGVQQTLLIQL